MSLKNGSRRRMSIEKRNGLAGWFFIAPFVIGVILIFAGIVVDSIRYSFSDIVITGTGYTLDFVGWENYKYALTVDPDFVRLVVTTFGDFALTTFVTIFFSLFIAMVLNQKMRGRGFFRAMFMLPVVLATGIVAQADASNALMERYQDMSGIEMGNAALGGLDLAQTLQNMYIDSSVVDFITGLINNIYSVVNYSGVQILLFLAALQAISPSIYESARMEGATGWESFWKITLPIVSPIIYVNTIYTAVDSFTRADNSVMSLISTTMVGKTDYGGGTAMAWVYFLLILLVLGAISLISRRLVYYQEK